MRDQLLIGYDSDNLLALDTIEGLNINITKSVYSIEDPSKRLSDFTKTVQIPGSKNNDGIFSSLFDVNFHVRDSQQLNPDFNPTKKATCFYIQDQITLIEGYCQLTQIIVLDKEKVIYELVIYGLNSDIFSKLGNKLLTDLTGFGDLTWNDTEIKDSWTTPSAGGGVYYPMLDQGRGFTNRFSFLVPGGFAVDYQSFFPWMYVREIFYLIFDNIGVGGSAIDSDFLNTETFKRLILQCDPNKFTYDEAQKENSKAEAIRNTNQNVTVNYNSTDRANIYANQQWVFNSVVQDNLGQYNNTTGTITVLNEGYHTLTGNIEVEYTSFVATQYSCYIILKRSGVYSIISNDLIVIPGAGVQTVTSTIDLKGYYL